MRPELIGPQLTFVDIYLAHCLKKGEQLERRALALGMTYKELADMAGDGVESMDFKLTLMEEKKWNEN